MTVHFLVSYFRHASVYPREAVNVGISLYLLNHSLTLMETDYHYDYDNDDNDKLACSMFSRTKEDHHRRKKRHNKRKTNKNN